MKEKIIQGGIVNGEKMLVCPTWEDEFQKAIHKTGGCFRISMDYSAVDVSWWKELEKIAGKYGYTLDSESLEIIQEYVQKYKLGAIRYVQLEKTGSDHDPVFTVEVRLDNEPRAVGVGKSKKQAESDAAGKALMKIRRKKSGTRKKK